MKTNKQTKEKRYNSMKGYLKDHPEDEEVKDELLAYEDGYKQGRKDAIDEILKIIDKEKYSKDEWFETFESVFQDGYNKALNDIEDKLRELK
jgi:hypothetical protein